MRSLALVLALLLVATGARAQETTSPERGGIQFFVGSLGVGVGKAGYGKRTYMSSIKATVATPRYAFSARAVVAEEANYGIFTPSPLRYLAEVALLAGVRASFAGGWFLARAQAGPGLVFEQRRGALLPSDCGFGQLFCVDEYERERARALGVAGEAELVFTPIPYAGIGLRCDGNVNGARSFGGLSLALHVGRLY